ncbi:hypothetical protein AVEN_220325-1, partial [Araneus ventricosus]
CNTRLQRWTLRATPPLLHPYPGERTRLLIRPLLIRELVVSPDGRLAFLSDSPLQLPDLTSVAYWTSTRAPLHSNSVARC